MIISKLRRLRFEKEERDGTKLTYERLTAETGLSSNTLAALLKTDPIKRLDGDTVSALCRYFACGVGELLEYVPDAEEGKTEGKAGEGKAGA